MEVINGFFAAMGVVVLCALVLHLTREPRHGQVTAKGARPPKAQDHLPPTPPPSGKNVNL